MKTEKAKVFRGVLSLVLLAAWAIPASAAPKRLKARQGEPRSESATARPAADTACPADDSAALPGLRAFIDPQTGQLREPTPEEAQSLAKAAREEFVRALKSLEAVVHPDGMISLDLMGLFMQDIVVVKRPDGTLSMRCVPDSERANVLLAPAPPKPAPLEER